MSDQNIYISNGTCYSAAGKKLDGSFVPCGNDAFGHQTCCGAGDNCLADNACFGVHGSGYGSYLTYMAGCSDPDYKDASCPDKEGIDQPWIALTLCDNSDGVWAACSQEGNPTTLQPGSFCSCTDTASATVAFSDANSLTNICSLPESTGDSIQYFAGHIPTSPSSAKTTTAAGSSDTTTARSSGSTATATQTGATTSTQSDTNTSNSDTATPGAGSSGTSATATTTGTNSASPSATGTAAANSDTSSGTSSGAKIGIGVGVALGVLLLLAIIAAFLIRRRKRRRSPSEVEKGRVNGAKLSKPDPADPHRVSALSATPRASEADGQAISEADGKAVSKADKLAMAEADGHALLEADGKAVSKADKLPISEADGQAVSEVDGRAARPWSMRSELEGTEGAVAGKMAGGDLLEEVRLQHQWVTTESNHLMLEGSRLQVQGHHNCQVNKGLVIDLPKDGRDGGRNGECGNGRQQISCWEAYQGTELNTIPTGALAASSF
ncbi:hypothetical protein SCUP234_08144 [Seiridium cupressi]